jgi:hypothetical protein
MSRQREQSAPQPVVTRPSVLAADLTPPTTAAVAASRRSYKHFQDYQQDGDAGCMAARAWHI